MKVRTLVAVGCLLRLRARSSNRDRARSSGSVDWERETKNAWERGFWAGTTPGEDAGT